MVLHQPPEASGVGVIRRTFGYQQAATEITRDAGTHRAHHPAHVAHEEKPVAGFEVAADMHIAGDHRAEKTDMGKHATLWLAGGARGVQQDRWRFGIHLRRRMPSRLTSDQHRPVMVAAGLHGAIQRLTDMPQHQHMLYAGDFMQRLVEHAFHRRCTAAPPGAVHRQYGLRLAVIQPRDQGLRPETGKQRHQHGADLEHREKRDKGFRHIRHVQPDAITACYAQRFKRRRQPAYLGIKLTISVGALRLWILAFPYEEGLFPHRRATMPVEAIQHNIGRAADAPARPFDAARGIEHPGIRLVKTEVAERENFLHQPGGIGIGARHQGFIAWFADALQEGRQRGLRYQLRRGLPFEFLLFRHEELTPYYFRIVPDRFISPGQQ